MTCPIALAMPNSSVDLLSRELDVMHACGYSKIDFRMGLSKPTEPMHEPFGRKIWRCADCQNAGGSALKDTIGTNGYSIECITHYGKVLATGLGNHEPLALAIEEPQSERRL
jgi:hypothetical protein